MVFTVRDAAGEIVQQVEGPAEAGFNRVAWNLRYPELEPWNAEKEEKLTGTGGVLVAPGTYSVTMSRRVDGLMSAVGEPETFEVVSVRADPVLPGSSQEERVIFESELDELQRANKGTVAAIDAMVIELDAVKAALERSTDDGSMYATANSIQQQLKDTRDRLADNPQRLAYRDIGEMTVTARLYHARYSSVSQAYGPTPAQRESYRIARAAYDGVVSRLTTLVDNDYASLKLAMDAAGVPWTPGRGVQRPGIN